MPLVLRPHPVHYPDDGEPPQKELHVILSGGLSVGSVFRVSHGMNENRYAWGVGLTGNAGFSAFGHDNSVGECKPHIGRAFRKMLARASLRERADAQAGPPRRAQHETVGEASWPPPQYDGDADRRIGPLLRNELRRAARSGELVAGVLERSTRGPEIWTWTLASLHKPDDLVWSGTAKTEAEAFDTFARCWSQWLYWAGLEQVGELQRGVKPG
jgi:hypothetical protein